MNQYGSAFKFLVLKNGNIIMDFSEYNSNEHGPNLKIFDMTTGILTTNWNQLRFPLNAKLLENGNIIVNYCDCHMLKIFEGVTFR